MLVDIKVPVLAESVSTATLIKWQKQLGEQVKRGDNLIDIETDKITLEITALNDGVITEILKNNGEEVTSDEVIARIDTAATSAAEAPPPEPAAAPAAASSHDVTKLSPAVRHMLTEHNLDPATIPTESGRLSKADVLAYLESQGKPVTTAQPKAEPSATVMPQQTEEHPVETSVTAPAPAPASPAAATVTKPAVDRPTERVAMTQLRKRIAARLLGAQQDNAILTTFNEVNMQPVMAIRSKYKAEFEQQHGVKLGFMSFFTRAVSHALKTINVINASVEGDDIIYHHYYDIGIAVSSPRGLVVPTIRNCDTLSLADIELAIKDYGNKAQAGKLTMEDLTGGTFTITNGGVFGSLLSTPIINPPQSAILGMHTIQQRAVVEADNIVIRPMMYIALSYDHRIIDGREAVQFLILVKKQLEDPTRFLLQLS